jgi:hypothetical protein
MSRSNVFAEILTRGAVKAVVYFSGGHDEGGCDSIVLVDADDKKVIELDPYPEYAKNPSCGCYQCSDSKDWNVKHAVLDQRLTAFVIGLKGPVDDQYGTFAGEFYVTGTVVWDATEKTCRMSGDERVEVGHGIDREF